MATLHSSGRVTYPFSQCQGDNQPGVESKATPPHKKDPELRGEGAVYGPDLYVEQGDARNCED